jgi:hypothetical protein
MRDRRLTRCLICPVLLLAPVAGCQAFHSYRPVAVLAQDAETKKPIPGAEVSITYPVTPAMRAPWFSVGKAGDDGIARLEAAPAGDAGILVTVTVPGYMSQEKNLPVEAVQAIEPAHFFEATERRPPSFVLELWAEPDPVVELILPTDYRGLVKAEIQVQDDAPCPPGQRCFPCVVPPSGVVQMTGPPLLRRVYGADFRARFADGVPLSQQAKGAEVGLWWLRCEGSYQCFLVGTRTEYDAIRRSEQKDGAAESRSTGGKGDGRGRRSRRGNQPPSDASPAGMSPQNSGS